MEVQEEEGEEAEEKEGKGKEREERGGGSRRKGREQEDEARSRNREIVFGADWPLSRSEKVQHILRCFQAELSAVEAVAAAPLAPSAAAERVGGRPSPFLETPRMGGSPCGPAWRCVAPAMAVAVAAAAPPPRQARASRILSVSRSPPLSFSGAHGLHCASPPPPTSSASDFDVMASREGESEHELSSVDSAASYQSWQAGDVVPVHRTFVHFLGSPWVGPARAASAPPKLAGRGLGGRQGRARGSEPPSGSGIKAGTDTIRPVMGAEDGGDHFVDARKFAHAVEDWAYKDHCVAEEPEPEAALPLSTLEATDAMASLGDEGDAAKAGWTADAASSLGCHHDRDLGERSDNVELDEGGMGAHGDLVISTAVAATAGCTVDAASLIHGGGERFAYAEAEEVDEEAHSHEEVATRAVTQAGAPPRRRWTKARRAAAGRDELAGESSVALRRPPEGSLVSPQLRAGCDASGSPLTPFCRLRDSFRSALLAAKAALAKVENNQADRDRETQRIQLIEANLAHCDEMVRLVSIYVTGGGDGEAEFSVEECAEKAPLRVAAASAAVRASASASAFSRATTTAATPSQRDAGGGNVDVKQDAVEPPLREERKRHGSAASLALRNIKRRGRMLEFDIIEAESELAVARDEVREIYADVRLDAWPKYRDRVLVEASARVSQWVNRAWTLRDKLAEVQSQLRLRERGEAGARSFDGGNLDASDWRATMRTADVRHRHGDG